MAAESSANETARVDAALDALLAKADPRTTDPVEFRGLQYDHGLAWVHHPAGLGGLGVSPKLQGRVLERLTSAGSPPIDPTLFFLQLAGPTIATHGTPGQHARFMRPMFAGAERWCQLFSEPGAGSDLAGVACRAVRDGDEWILNGQKVWNTLAHLADLGIIVTRTDPDVPKHKGLTFFVIDMHAPGVDVRPLRQMTGEAEFNEVYMTDVRVPDSFRIGDVGEGWRVAMTTLMNERVSIGSSAAPKQGSGPISELMRTWNESPVGARTEVRRDRMAQLWIEAEVNRLTNIRANQARVAGNPGPEGSIAKIALATLNKKIFELAVEVLGPAGQVDFDYTFRRAEMLNDETWGDARHGFLRVRANSIEGGTTEILKNVTGEQVLGLPGEPRVDKELPWAKVPRS
jgi:alkylation response protein AidB-like acyl-CoA dehydrogenase